MALLFNFILLQVPLVATTPQEAIDPSKGLGTMQLFVSGIFPTLVQIIAAIAILYIAYWGLMYMLSNIPGIKKAGSERIWSILGGLLLALSAWLILETINPAIIKSLDTFIQK